MANESNLRPVRTKEEARERGSRGGKASAEARKRRKSMKECMELAMGLKLTNSDQIAELEELGIDKKEMNHQMLSAVRLLEKAEEGNVNAMNSILELLGEKVIQMNVNANLDDKVKELDKLLEEVADE